MNRKYKAQIQIQVARLLHRTVKFEILNIIVILKEVCGNLYPFMATCEHPEIHDPVHAGPAERAYIYLGSKPSHTVGEMEIFQ